MKRFLVYAASAAMFVMVLVACTGKDGASNQNGESADTTAVVTEEAKKLEVETMVKDAYKTAFSTILSLEPMDLVFEDYCTEEFNKIRTQYEKNNEGSVGVIDYDLFIQCQDLTEQSTFEIEDIAFDGDIAIVSVQMVIDKENEYETSAQLNVKKEGESWKIDDFIGINGSAKEVMAEDNELHK